MIFLSPYYNKINDSKVEVSATQGSAFAKQVANDFNPIHNIDSKRFCVPGDLLFAIALQKYSLHQKMSFQFEGLVKANAILNFPDNATELKITNERSKPVLSISKTGENSSNEQQLEMLIKNYVSFSGHNFPHILVPLMREHQIMINPERPLVIYESMSLDFVSLDFIDPIIELDQTNLLVNGKRGDAQLTFTIKDETGRKIGSGIKNLVLSGLREYEQSAVDDMCQRYQQYSNLMAIKH